MTEERTQLEQQLTALQRRLHVLEQQRAGFGELHVPVHIVLECAHVAADITRLRVLLQQLRERAGQGAAPYVGLYTFQEHNAGIFFGRAVLVAQLANKLRQAPFLAVLGPSGSGKSSVVRAGLIPALKDGVLEGSEQWKYIVMTPGGVPLDTLAARLAQLHGDDLAGKLPLSQQLAGDERALVRAAELLGNGRGPAGLVVVVDQAEELWTQLPVEHE